MLEFVFIDARYNALHSENISVFEVWVGGRSPWPLLLRSKLCVNAETSEQDQAEPVGQKCCTGLRTVLRLLRSPAPCTRSKVVVGFGLTDEITILLSIY